MMSYKTTPIILGVIIVTFIVILFYLNNEGFSESTYGAAPDTPGQPCQAGFWCPEASGGSKGYPCPGGTYGNTTMLVKPSCSGYCNAGCVCKEASTEQCPAACPAGYYCVEGTGGATPPIICPQGYYCPESTSVPKSCPAGVFCAAGTSSVP
jgi:hypothetical protein